MEKIIKALEKNNFEVHYFEKKEEILAFVKQFLPEDSKISNGGSQSVTECGVFDLIKSGKYNYIDRFAATTPEDEKKMIADYFTADYFFCSANAITENGELVNVDGRSNRVAALLYGPRYVVAIVGKNKIVKDISEALYRVKTVAAPQNTVRLSCNTYCREAGRCVAWDNPQMASGCGSDARICCNYVVSAHQREKGRIKILLCGEDLGF